MDRPIVGAVDERRGRGAQGAAKSRQAALEAARRAVELDPADAEGYAALGVALGALGNLVAAERAFAKALELNSNHPGVLAAYAAWASTFGRPEEGAAAADRLLRLDPGYPAWGAGSIGYRLSHGGQVRRGPAGADQRPEAIRSPEIWWARRSRWPPSDGRQRPAPPVLRPWRGFPTSRARSL